MSLITYDLMGKKHDKVISALDADVAISGNGAAYRRWSDGQYV